MSRTIQKLRKEMAQVAKYAADERAIAETTIRRVLGASQDAKSLAELSVASGTLATYDGVEGALQVLDGNANGWEQMELSWRWKATEQRVLRRLYDIDPRPRKNPYSNPRDLAIVLLHALTLAEPEMDWLRDQGRESFSGGVFDVVRTFPLAVYALTLADGTTTYNGEDDSVYRRVIEAWNDDARLRDAIVAMCDYHMTRTEDVDDTETWMEFEFYPYTIFPVEYLALVRVRERAGLATPRPDHPLLNTPLAQLPPAAGTTSPLIASVHRFLGI